MALTMKASSYLVTALRIFQGIGQVAAFSHPVPRNYQAIGTARLYSKGGSRGGGGSGKGGGGKGGGGSGKGGGAGKGSGPGNAGGWPSTTGNPSGGGRSNNPPSK